MVNKSCPRASHGTGKMSEENENPFSVVYKT